jgi:hypothetical protein
MNLFPPSTATVTPNTTTTYDNDSSIIVNHKTVNAADDTNESNAVTSASKIGTVVPAAFLQRHWKAISLIVMMVMMIVLFGMSIHFYKEARDSALKQEVTLDILGQDIEWFRNTTASSGCTTNPSLSSSTENGNNTTMEDNATSNMDGSHERDLGVCPDADYVFAAAYTSRQAVINCNTLLTYRYGCSVGCARSFNRPYQIVRGGGWYNYCFCGYEGTWYRVSY